MKNKYEDNAFGQIVGRDNQIIREALSIAIPMMLRHSLAWSNTKDMMRILETLGPRTPTNLIQGRELKEKIIEVIGELRNGKRHKARPNTPNLDNLVEKYLADITDHELR